MKILMLGWELPPFNSGGLGVACYYLCRSLASQGVSIDFVLPGSVPAGYAVDFMRVHTTGTVAGTGAYGTWSPQVQAQKAAYAKTVMNLVKKNDYHAIHAHDWLTLEAAVQAKNYTGKPLIAHVHSTEFDRSGNMQGNALVHEIEQTCLLLADRIVAVSRATKNILVQKYGLPPEAVQVIYSATDPTIFAPTKHKKNTYTYLERMRARGYKVVMTLGRLTVQKGLNHFLRSAQLALQYNPRLLFVVAGDGEQRNELIELSAELGIANNVIFTGF